MIYKFADFVIDTDRRTLSKAEDEVHVEPQVFDLLVLLVINHHRVLSRDEIIEKIWNGRFVSDGAVSSRIRDLRRALEDTAEAQKFVQTLRGHGFRFVGKVEMVADAPLPAAVTSLQQVEVAQPVQEGQTGSQPSIAVLPFERVGDPALFPAIEEAIPRELITTLASLRWVKVISNGSSFRFRGSGQDLAEVGRILNVKYILTGFVEVMGPSITIDTELSDISSLQVVWAMRRTAPLEDVQELRQEIASSIILVCEREISEHESASVDYLNIENLDAWSAMHRGVQHMNQFSQHGNQVAEQMFELALKKDPKLARAYSGLAFVRFQNAFMRYVEGVDAETDRAFALVEKSLELQPFDPFGNFMMGRCHWLQHDPGGSKPWFDRSVQASPNYTWGYYGSAWADVFTGETTRASGKADRSIYLSPIDPMRPGMTGVKMWVHIAEGDYPSAIKWAEIAARTPWAHAGMALFAAMSHWLNGDAARSADWMTEVRRRNPNFSMQHLMTLVPETSTEFRQIVREAAIGMGLR